MGVLASAAPAWTGAVAGLVALAVFVVFSGWIITTRLRANRKDRNG